jgi:hypothetical protein
MYVFIYATALLVQFPSKDHYFSSGVMFPQDDDVPKLARQFGSGRHMDKTMIQALINFLQSEMDKRSS